MLAASETDVELNSLSRRACSGFGEDFLFFVRNGKCISKNLKINENEKIEKDVL